MKASELRIGNWVRSMGSIPHEINGYRLYMMENYVPKDPKEANYEEMTEPIPLTEEWLKKFGWEDESKTTNFKSYRKRSQHDGPEDWYITWDDQHGWMFWYEDQRLCDVEHIHTLQNVWHSLTGEELMIKE